jgi:hypothetical protein
MKDQINIFPHLIGGTPYNCEKCGTPAGHTICYKCRQLPPNPTKKWKVKFVHAGWEPPYPFGKCEEFVEATSREEAIEYFKQKGIVSRWFKITASAVKEEKMTPREKEEMERQIKNNIVYR